MQVRLLFQYGILGTAAWQSCSYITCNPRMHLYHAGSGHGECQAGASAQEEERCRAWRGFECEWSEERDEWCAWHGSSGAVLMQGCTVRCCWDGAWDKWLPFSTAAMLLLHISFRQKEVVCPHHARKHLPTCLTRLVVLWLPCVFVIHSAKFSHTRSSYCLTTWQTLSLKRSISYTSHDHDCAGAISPAKPRPNGLTSGQLPLESV